jgi:hypothetical protein
MKKLFILLCCIVQLLAHNAYSFGLSSKKWGEELEKPSPWFYGLGFGVNFFPDGLIGQSSGMVAYRLNRKSFLAINPSISYLYQRIDVLNTTIGREEIYHYQSAYYDVSLSYRLFFYKRIFLQVEPGIVNYKDLEGVYFDPIANKATEKASRLTVPYALAGLGFLAPVGEKSFFVMRVQYDVLGKENSPYKGYPVIRGGINFSF